MRNKFIESILDQRNRPDAINNILKSERNIRDRRWNSPSSKRRRGGDHDVVTGVYRGNYFRIKIPHGGNASELPKIPAVAPTPNFSFILSKKTRGSSKDDDYLRWIIEWLQKNWATLLLNFGSICTLAAFTRSDVLELRSLSATGSICNALFHFYSKSNVPSIVWPSIFASVNGYKIGEIIVERNADVHMTEEQESIYVEHFLQHGVTPKMFELLSETSEKFHVKKNGVIIRKGATVDHVYLVVSGSTSASILGRYLTAYSTSSEKRAKPDRMHSGTWIGEMNFLDWAWEQNQPATLQVSPRKLEKQNDASKASDSVRKTESASSTTNVHQLNVQQKEAISASAAATTTITQPKEDADNPKHKLVESLYTIVAKEDCVVWRWSFDEMQQLMNRSTDMRGALSRAMTTAITAKVVNLTLNRATHLPTWTTWLSDWTREDGASIRLRRIQTLPEDANNYDDGTGSGEGQDKQPQLPP